LKTKIQHWFLVRLFKESRIGFTVVVLFFGLWIIVIVKNMDMTLFPRNDMFSSGSPWMDTLTESYVYYNGQPLGYTNMPYWKKDMLQTSAASYVRYVDNNRSTRTEQWLRNRSFNGLPLWLSQRLTAPTNVTDNEWLAGYVNMMGLSMQSGDLLQLCQLRFTVRKGIALIHQTDTITSCIYP
jgi:hypothetical protein